MKVTDLKPKPPKILLYSGAGTGKTAFVSTLGEGLQLYDLDDGITTCLTLEDEHSKARKSIDVRQCLEDDPTKAMAFKKLQSYLNGVVKECHNGTYAFNALAIDSFTALADYAIRFAKYNSGHLAEPRVSLPEYGVAFSILEDVVLTLRALPILTIIIFHEMNIEIDETNTVEIAIPGKQLPYKIPRFFDEIWYLDVKRRAQNKVERRLFTAKTPAIRARSRLNVPDNTNIDVGLPKILKDVGFDLQKQGATNE
tara:strand:+ start:452 stop:1213 length:762 start_codon:yes stop_codon:yes gene_type:complete